MECMTIGRVKKVIINNYLYGILNIYAFLLTLINYHQSLELNTK